MHLNVGIQSKNLFNNHNQRKKSNINMMIQKLIKKQL